MIVFRRSQSQLALFSRYRITITKGSSLNENHHGPILLILHIFHATSASFFSNSQGWTYLPTLWESNPRALIFHQVMQLSEFLPLNLSIDDYPAEIVLVADKLLQAHKDVGSFIIVMWLELKAKELQQRRGSRLIFEHRQEHQLRMYLHQRTRPDRRLISWKQCNTCRWRKRWRRRRCKQITGFLET